MLETILPISILNIECQVGARRTVTSAEPDEPFKRAEANSNWYI